MKKVLKPKFEKLLGKIEKDIKNKKNISKALSSSSDIKKHLKSL